MQNIFSASKVVNEVPGLKFNVQINYLSYKINNFFK